MSSDDVTIKVVPLSRMVYANVISTPDGMSVQVDHYTSKDKQSFTLSTHEAEYLLLDLQSCLMVMDGVVD